MVHDFRDAVRALRGSPLLSTVGILSLALGIGANAAIFSLVDSLEFRALPVPHASRLALVQEGSRHTAWTNPIWEQIRDRPELFAGALAWSSRRFNLAPTGEARPVAGLLASGRFFEVLGVPAILGRTFTADDDRRGGGSAGPVAVISYPYWQRQYGGAADVIGRSMTIEGVAFTIIGVAPPGFFGPEVGHAFDVVVPLGTEPLMRGAQSLLDRRSAWWLDIMVRLKPGQDLASGSALLRTLQPRIREATLPSNWGPQDLADYLSTPFVLLPAATGISDLRARYRGPLAALFVVTGLVLLVACGNIANLMLARATARRHELGVRQALGASRWRIARHSLVESATLALAGTVVGAFVAVWGSRLLVRQLSIADASIALHLGLDWRFFGFMGMAGIATALVFGTLPALRAARADPIEALNEGGRSSSAQRASLGGGLVVAQVALSLVLVVSAGLFVRTFAGLATMPLGFDPSRVLVVTANALRSEVPDVDRAALYGRLAGAVAEVPGVGRAAASLLAPMGKSTWSDHVAVPGGPPLPERERSVYVNMLTPGWFATLRARVLAGRDFKDDDRAGAPEVAIVNEEFARHFLAGANPIGRLIRQDEAVPGQTVHEYRIVGLVADAVYRYQREGRIPTVYLPLAQQTDLLTSVNLIVRSSGDRPIDLAHSVIAAASRIDPRLSFSVHVLARQVDDAISRERLVAMLAAFFGGLALLLAGLGLYGVTAYGVGRRRTEIGIRLALGTPPSGVQRLVLRRVGAQLATGILLGALVSLWASRFVRSLLYGVGPQDPATFAGAAVALAAAGALAGWLPARRASRIDPVEVLRQG